METSRLTTRILMETEKLIMQSCASDTFDKKSTDLHKLIIKKHYNAADVAIDYVRHRINMDVIISEEDYDPKTVNLALATVPVNIFFKNLCDFLKSCLEKDVKSLAFYSRILMQYTNKNMALHAF
ncbi:hypothetical protein [Allomuricauda sp. SCSIO 65647]|uniref:hypothetical protein n=1 Tax=Allomuricauda sp. SCSIO 65647 TaxID=2908843 RepID=UPI001F2FFDCD|nr:hypothetical protein [Muricauda sp. SCSIO 65647]UJH68738.1 hypothetical protein L0P89_05860 [Muricauda sp. SCSIO 65647]